MKQKTKFRYNKILGLDDLMPFGAHKGTQVEDLLDDQPGYIEWLIEEDICDFDEATKQAIEKRKTRR